MYALGLLLYEMLCGRPPFGGDTDVATAMARLTTSAPPIRAQRPDVPPALDDIVHRCLARDPARRFASASAVRAALAAVRTDPQGPRRAAPARHRPATTARRHVHRRRGDRPATHERDDMGLGRRSCSCSRSRPAWPRSSCVRDDQSNSRSPTTTARSRRLDLARPTAPAHQHAGRSLRDDDADLAARASRGDRRALETLLDRHADRVHALCRRVIAHREDALDATQEAMIAIARGIDRFDGRSAFTTWLYRVATNAALDELRRKQRRPDPVDVSAMRSRRRPGPPSTARSSDRLDVDAALATMPDRLPGRGRAARPVDLDYAEIAEVLEIPPGTVRSRIARAGRCSPPRSGTRKPLPNV